MAKVYVVGVGMTRFRKPQKAFDPKEPDYTDFAKVAVNRALDDACLTYDHLQAAAVGSAFGPKGQRALYDMKMTGIPIFNVSNACATGSNALFLARSFVAGGMHDCCLALGLEIMQPGPLGGGTRPKGPGMMDHHLGAMQSKFEITKDPINAQVFGNAGREHNAMYGSTPKDFALVGAKNHRHSINNPYSQFRDEYQCSPTSDGAAAAIVCSEKFVLEHGLQGQAIEIIGQSMKTDLPSAFEGGQDRSCINMVGFEMARKAAEDVYRQTGKTPKDVQVVELHDCFSCNELITYEALGLAKEGEGHHLIRSGDVTYGGKWVVNPSGGLISKGHPLGATGLAQCAELNWQLRGEAGKRQVPYAKVALQHNLGLGGNVVITMYMKPDRWAHIPAKREMSLGSLDSIPSKL